MAIGIQGASNIARIPVPVRKVLMAFKSLRPWEYWFPSGEVAPSAIFSSR